MTDSTQDWMSYLSSLFFSFFCNGRKHTSDIIMDPGYTGEIPERDAVSNHFTLSASR